MKIFIFCLWMIVNMTSNGQNLNYLNNNSKNKDTSWVNTHFEKAALYIASNPDSALKYNEKGLIGSKILNWRYGKWKLMHQRGNIYLNINQYIKAIKSFDEAIQVWKLDSRFKEKDDLQYQSIARSLGNKGLALFNMGDYKEALKNQLSSLYISEKISYTIGVGRAYINIGNIYNAQNTPQDLDRATSYYSKAISVFKKLQDERLQMVCFGNIGVIAYKNKQYSKALRNYNYSLEIAQRLNDGYQVGYWLNNIGEAYADSGLISKAKSFFEASIDNAQKVKDDQQIAIGLANLGMLCFEEGKYLLAEEYLISALKLISDKNILDYEIQILDFVSKIYEINHNYELAFRHQKRLIQLKDSVFASNKRLEIEQELNKYTQQKQSEISYLKEAALLAQQDTIKSQGTARLVVSVSILLLLLFSGLIIFQRYRFSQSKKLALSEQRRWLSAINPHFVSNTMMSIKSFLRKNPEMASEYTVKYNLVLRDILDLSSREKVSLEEELETLERYMQLEQLRVQFNYAIEIDPKLDSSWVKVPPLLLQPVVENSIKHGIEPLDNSEGRINIHIFEEAGLLNYQITDNGVGANPELNARKENSVGSTTILKAILELLNNGKKDRYQLEKLSIGTRVTLKFPI